jgi:hypothetical protein
MYPLHYKTAIHPDCGKEVEIHKDIIITPFYTEEFCDELIKLAKFYDDKFTAYIVYSKEKTHELTHNSPWETLFYSRISPLLFEAFCEHYQKYLCPVLEQHFLATRVVGWFSPMIIKYSHRGQEVTLHNDTSGFTFNIKLNTNYEGSVLEFPRQNWNNKKVPRGWCYIWPSRVTHPHRATPLKKGIKYTLSSWTHPVAWNPDQMGGSILRNVQTST